MNAMRRYLKDMIGEDPGEVLVVLAFEPGNRRYNGSLTLDVYGLDEELVWDYSQALVSASGEDARAILEDLATWTPGDSVHPAMSETLRVCVPRMRK